MNLYIFRYGGVWLSGYSVAIAENEEQVRTLVTPIVHEATGNSDGVELKAVLPVTEPVARLVWDGDY